MKNFKFTFGDFSGNIVVMFYNNQRLALRWNQLSSSFPIATLTVNLVNEEILPDEVFIDVNNLSHLWHEDIIEALKFQGIIEGITWYAKSGYVTYPKVKLSKDVLTIC